MYTLTFHPSIYPPTHSPIHPHDSGIRRSLCVERSLHFKRKKSADEHRFSVFEKKSADEHRFSVFGRRCRPSKYSAEFVAALVRQTKVSITHLELKPKKMELSKKHR